MTFSSIIEFGFVSIFHRREERDKKKLSLKMEKKNQQANDEM